MSRVSSLGLNSGELPGSSSSHQEMYNAKPLPGSISALPSPTVPGNLQPLGTADALTLGAASIYITWVHEPYILGPALGPQSCHECWKPKRTWTCPDVPETVNPLQASTSASVSLSLFLSQSPYKAHAWQRNTRPVPGTSASRDRCTGAHVESFQSKDLGILGCGFCPQDLPLSGCWPLGRFLICKN